MKRHCKDILEESWRDGKFTGVSLDSEYGRIKSNRNNAGDSVAQRLLRFNASIIDSTSGVACAYKLNLGHYLEQGSEGIRGLKDTIDYAHKFAPRSAIILDFKCGDIATSTEMYMRAAFDNFRVDGVTLNAYPGLAASDSFTKRMPDKCFFFVTAMSNEGASEFQDINVSLGSGAHNHIMPLYQYIAMRVGRTHAVRRNCCVVVSARHIEKVRAVRNLVGDMAMLLPGLGTQSESIDQEKLVGNVVSVAQDYRGKGMIFPIGRDIIFAQNPSERASFWHDRIRAAIRK